MYPSIFEESWVEGKTVVRKSGPSTVITEALRVLSGKIHIRSITRRRLRLELAFQEQHLNWSWSTDDVEASYLGKKRRKRTGRLFRVLFTDESNIYISFKKLRSRDLEKTLRGLLVTCSTECRFHSQWWFLPWHLLMLDLGVFCSPQLKQPSTRKCYSIPSADALHGDTDFLFQKTQHLNTLPMKLVHWSGCYWAWLTSNLAWHKPHTESITYCQQDELRNTKSNNANELKAIIKGIWASITPQHCYRLMASILHNIDEIIHAKWEPTECWMYEN